MSTINIDIEDAARRLGVTSADVEALFADARTVSYESGECLFHESTPREWMGILLEGTVELVRGLHGQRRTLALDEILSPEKMCDPRQLPQ